MRRPEHEAGAPEARPEDPPRSGRPRPELPTRVAQAHWTEHDFMGYRVFAELAGHESLWSMLSLACGGPRLDTAASDVLDEINVCLAVADPHIWGPKVTRLIAAYGRPMPALCAGSLVVAEALIGSRHVVEAARDLVALRAAVGDPLDDESRVAAVLDEWLAAGRRLSGYGVPFRPQDERVVAIRRGLARRGLEDRPYVRLLTTVDHLLQRRSESLAPNAAGITAAACLDLGLEPRHLFGLIVAFALAPFAANAHEGSQQQPALLRRLPAEWVRYVGRGPRQSPRAHRSDPA